MRSLLLALLLACRTPPAPPPPADGSELHVLTGLQIEYPLAPGEAATVEKTAGVGQLHTDFAVAPNGGLVMRGGDALLEISTNGDELRLDRLLEQGAPDRFILDGSSLLGVRGRTLGTLVDNELVEAVPLPSSGMRLASAPTGGVAYLFGGPPELARRVYSFYESGGLEVLAEIPVPIIAVTAGARSVYVATAHEVWRLRADQIELVVRFEEDDAQFTSLAVTPDEKLLFMATASSVYVMHGATAMLAVRNAGGELRFAQEALWLWDPQRKLVARVSNLHALLQERKS